MMSMRAMMELLHEVQGAGWWLHDLASVVGMAV